MWRDRPEAWTHQDELLATGVERIDYWLRRMVGLWTDPKYRHSLPKPLRIERPGEPVRKKVTTDPREIRAFFDRRGR